MANSPAKAGQEATSLKTAGLVVTRISVLVAIGPVKADLEAANLKFSGLDAHGLEIHTVANPEGANKSGIFTEFTFPVM